MFKLSITSANEGMRAHAMGLGAREPPSQPDPPIIENINNTSALLTWQPLRQQVTRIELQAVQVKKKHSKGTVAFRKLDKGKDISAKSTSLTSGASFVSSGVVSGLTTGSYYVFRLVATNAAGTTCGACTPPALASSEEPKPERRRSFGSLRRKKLERKLAKLQRISEEAQAAKQKELEAENRRAADTPTAPKQLPRVSVETVATIPPAELHDHARAHEKKAEADPQVVASAVDLSAQEQHQPRMATQTAQSETESQTQSNSKSTSHTTPSEAENAERNTGSDGLPVDDTAASNQSSASLTATAPTKRKGINDRLGIKTANVITETSRLEELEQKRANMTRMFKSETEEQEEKSRIFKALNPGKLWYESRREKEELDEDKVELSIRGGAAGTAGVDNSYEFLRDDEGNLVEDDAGSEEEDESDDDYDPENVPDFGEYQAIMDELRKKREAAAEQHRKELKEQWLAMKKEEEAQRQRELEAIQEKEKKLRAKKEVSDDDIQEARERLAQCTFTFTFN